MNLDSTTSVTWSATLRRRAIVALIAVNLLWGISFPLMKMTNQLMSRHHMSAAHEASGKWGEAWNRIMDVSAFLLVRFSIALVMLFVLMRDAFRDLTARQWLMGMVTGGLFFAGMLPQVLALNEIPASRSGFLTSLSVVFTPFLMIAVERRLPRAVVAAGAAVAFLGTAILTGAVEVGRPFGLQIAADFASRIGLWDWVTAGAAFLFAWQIIAIDVFSRRMPSGKLTPGMFVATLLLALISFSTGLAVQGGDEPISTWGSLVFNVPFMILTAVASLFCTVLAFHWMNKYQAFVSPAHAALIYTMEPIFATMWAMILPGLISPLVGLDYPSERPTWSLALGGLIIVGGNALALWPRKPDPAVS